MPVKKMKFIKTSATMILAILFLSTILVITPYVMASKDTTGNGAPSGPHYNLNIIGVPKEKRGGTWDNNGHRIFVKLYGANTKINLVAGDTFKVIDSDGTDGSAILQMMDPYPGDTTDAVYRIFVRALGKPGGNANMTSAFVDENGSIWYSLETVNLMRNKGKSRFDDKTLELTTIYVDMDGDGVPERYCLFDNELYDYFWNYDNNGLKLLQIRIYVD